MTVRSRIGDRYARALFLAVKSDMTRAKRIGDGLSVLEQLFSIPEAAKILVSPIFPLSWKKDILNFGLSKIAEQDEGNVLKNFIFTVLDARRIPYIPDIAKAYRSKLDEMGQKVTAEISSAAKLDSQDIDSIKKLLEGLFKKQIEIEEHIDPELLGGFSVNVGFTQIDLSLKSRLDSITEATAR